VAANRQYRQRVRPLPRGNALYTPGASATRQTAERRSAKPLLYLHQLPTWVVPAVLAVLLVVGLAVHGAVGAVALSALAAVLGWLAAMSWPRLSPTGKLSRVLAVVVIVGLAAYQASR
jgi:hypothetical protein